MDNLLSKIRKINQYSEVIFENKFVQWLLKPMSYNTLIWKFFITIIIEILLINLSTTIDNFFTQMINDSTEKYEQIIYSILNIIFSGGSWLIVGLALIFTILIFILKLLEIKYQRRITTNQLLTINEFIDAYQYSKFSTPLDITLYGRETEQNNLIELIKENNIVLVSGKAGIGKTKIVLESIKNLDNDFKYEPICIFNRGLNPLDDIQSYFSTDKKYLIFIDDVNRAHTAIDYLVNLYPEKIASGNLKIVLTVRDYAKNKVIDLIYNENFKINHYEIEELKDEIIKEILINDFNIKNKDYIERIEYLSQGNPRLAVMMAKIAIDTNSLESIKDISNIYDKYFKSIKNDIVLFENKDILKVASIIAFYRNVDKNNQEQMDEINDIFKIDKNKFWEEVQILNKYEIVDLYENELVKISDQILATYLFYQTIFIEELFDISLFLNNYFPTKKSKINDILIPIYNSFDFDYVLDKLKKSYQELEAKYKDNNKLYIELIEMFWYLDRTNNLIYIKNIIEHISEEEIDVINSQPYREYSSDKLLDLLKLFKQDFENYKIVIDLIFKYFEKNKFIEKELIEILTKDFGFDENSYRENYEIQKYIFSILASKINNDPFYKNIFFNIVNYYLKTVFDESKSKRNHTVTFYWFKNTETKYLKNFREKVWSQLFNIFSLYKKEVSSALLEYNIDTYHIDISDIEEWDKSILIDFFNNYLDEEEYIDCKIAQHFFDIWTSNGMEFDLLLKDKFTNEYIRIENIMYTDIYELWEENSNVKDVENIVAGQVYDFLKNYSVIDFENLFVVLNTIMECDFINSRDNYRLVTNSCQSFSLLADNKEDRFIEVMKLLLSNNYKMNFICHLMLKKYISILNKEKAYIEISSSKSLYANKLLFMYYEVLPTSAITPDDCQELIALYNKSVDPSELPYNILYLENYLQHNKDVFISIIKILYDKSKTNNNFLHSLTLLFNRFSELNSKIKEIFAENIDLLKDLYLSLDSFEQHFDFGAKSMNIILDLDSSFLVEYLEDKKSQDKQRDYTILWQREDYVDVLNQVINSLMKDKSGFFIKSKLRKFFYREQHTKKQELIEKQTDYLKMYIKKNIMDFDKIVFLYNDLIVNLEEEHKITFIKYFISLDDSFEHFEKISLTPSSMSWRGSAVPYYQKRKNFYIKILKLFDNTNLLKHKKRIEDIIKDMDSQIESEKKRDFLGDF